MGGTEAKRWRRENQGPERVGIGEPPTHFWHIWGPQNTSGKENCPNKASFLPLKNPLSWRLGSHAPLWLRPGASAHGRKGFVIAVCCSIVGKGEVLLRTIVTQERLHGTWNKFYLTYRVMTNTATNNRKKTQHTLCIERTHTVWLITAEKQNKKTSRC